jgi:hypothetical protein
MGWTDAVKRACCRNPGEQLTQDDQVVQVSADAAVV